MVLGGFAGSRGGARERDRLLENSAAVPLAETGEGVWRWPLVACPAFGGCERWKSVGAARLEKEEMPERVEMWEEKEEGSAPEKGFPFVLAGEDGLFDGGS